VTGRRATGARVERLVLVSLVAFRVALPLAVLAATGGSLLGLPVYVYNPRPGDAYGYYSAMRELLATWQRHTPVVLPAALVLAAVAVVLVRRRRRGRIRDAVVVVGIAWAAGLLATLLAAGSRTSGAPTIGWPLVWSVPLLPYRALGLPLDPDIAFAVGLALSLTCIAAIALATYVLGARVTASSSLGLVAAALFALWPVLVVPLSGDRTRIDGTWQNDLGVTLYSEPLSTALVTLALALVVRRRLSDTDAALAGALLGFSVAVRLSNVLIAGCVLVALLVRCRRLTLWTAGAAAAFAPLVIVYWPKGYEQLGPPTFPEHPFALDYARSAWTGSALWRPGVLLVLVPVALVGTIRLARPTALLLWSCILTTALFYTFYEPTPLHPRFLFVVLPIVLVLWAAGAAELVSAARRARLRFNPSRPPPRAAETPHRRRTR
jgi:hypothetical protein